MKTNLDDHVGAYQGNNLYDFDNRILLNWYPKRILRHTSGSKSLLELGLGHGFTTNIFSQNFSRHVVLEGSEAVIDNFRTGSPACAAEIVQTYFEEFDTAESFDVIVMGFILEHIEDPFTVVDRYRKFLAPGGKMFVAVPNAEVLNRRLGHLAGLLDDMQSLSENDLLLGHRRYYTVETLSSELVGAGYRIERLEGIYLKPFTTSQMISLNLDAKVIDALCEAGVNYPELSCGILAQAAAE
ncbi:MAG: class I SAM-dependent methyltransferase [Burkholderiales bacterium]|nr:class I SAM-dependent methyltransferase [Burkholderiales bacterium]